MMNLKDPKTQQTIVFVVVLILVLVLFFRFPYTSNQKKIKILDLKNDSLVNEVQKAEAARARLPELQAKIARLEAEWEKAKEMLPLAKEIPSLIQQISNSGTKAGVSFLLFKPGAPTPTAGTNYSEIPVQIKVVCDYHQLGKFISNVGNLSRIVNVPAVRIITGKERSVEAELSTLTYTITQTKEVTRGVPPRSK
jgi:type IV pilus assembly protein PilO